MWLFVLFLAVPIIEIALFIQVGGLIGLFPTLAIVILTAVLGTFMIRTQGMMAMNRLQQSFNELRNPTEPLAHGAMILFAGALLLTPGFFTDFVGFALLIPPVRTAIYNFLRSRIDVQGFTTGPEPPRQEQPGGTVIDGDYIEITEPNDPKNPGTSGWTKH